MKISKVVIPGLVMLAIASCSTSRKLSRIRSGSIQDGARLELATDTSLIPQIRNRPVSRDTLKIKDDDGNEFLIMRAIRNDETGEMVASDVLDAAVVTARFRNMAERHGKVDLEFQVIVPASMQDSRWQLRFYPDMFILDDSLRLDPVLITGNAYRKAQLRGYQQYNRFLSKIILDTTRFVDIRQLEIFLKRNIPQLYAFKSDTTVVRDEEFATIYGVSEQEAVEHYTNRIAKSLNERRKSRIDEMYRRYIKSPIVSDGIRLDTVMVSAAGDFIYNYIQTINTRPRLRKVDVVLSGEIFEGEKCLYEIPRSEPLTFYISSVSAFTDNTERYLTKVVERQAEANTLCYVAFPTGKSEVLPDFEDNAREIARISGNLRDLLQNREYDLDSIVVTASASPEGKETSNRTLSQRRSEAISRYFNAFIREVQDSLEQEAGLFIDESGRVSRRQRTKITFLSRTAGENWDLLDRLVERDTVMTEGDKSSFDLALRINDLDMREEMIKKEKYYPYMRNTLYPRLRSVAFNFYLHRKGMVKDTVHTTVLDSVYMRGVQALQNMDYEMAVRMLAPYADFNAAVAYTALDRNESALSILEPIRDKGVEVNYLLALLYSRRNEDEKAVEHYLRACRQNRSYVYRGNLDPEISLLIKMYGLNQEEEDDGDWME